MGVARLVAVIARNMRAMLVLAKIRDVDIAMAIIGNFNRTEYLEKHLINHANN
jgi:hypothetical protein